MSKHDPDPWVVLLLSYNRVCCPHGNYWGYHPSVFPVSKDPQIDIDYTLIRHESVGSMSNWCRSEGLCYLGYICKSSCCNSFEDQPPIDAIYRYNLQMQSRGAQSSNKMQRLDYMTVCMYICMYPDSKVHGANMGPIWGRQDPGGSHVGPMNFAIWGWCPWHLGPCVTELRMTIT